MLCDNCKNREANVRYEENINGEKKKLNLCGLCSQKLGLTSSSFMDNMLFSFFDEPLGLEYEKVKEEKCPECSYTFSDYANTGLFGCPACYSAFQSKLEPILKKLHGKSYHINQELNSEKKDISVEEKSTKELYKLKQELDMAIKKEEYEKAAIIRDKIKELNKRGEE